MNSHRTALILFAFALAIAFVAATITTLDNVNTRLASTESVPGTIGLAKPHPPLDRAPGVPLETPGQR